MKKINKKSKLIVGWGPHHSLVPDEGHPLLSPVHPLWDLGEVVLADGLLRHAEGAVGTASNVKVPTGEPRERETER